MKISCFVAVGVFACILQKTWGTNKPACSLPVDPGSCGGNFPRYYYDADTSQCQKFIFGGCGGNENNFPSELECIGACTDSYHDCYSPPDPGTCGGYFPRAFYDVNTGICREFIYGGCGGNQNNFESLQECHSVCIWTTSYCIAPPDPGPCGGYVPRAFYDVNTETCREFIYGGCGGNVNNFKSIQECQTNCGGTASR